MISHILIFLTALVLLAKGADFFVEYASRLAKRLGVSDLVIGLTLTSLGTSLPELASSISASLQHHSAFIIGNVAGSNIANIGLILGVSAAIKSFKTETKMYERDGFIMIASVIMFFGFSLDNRIATYEAVIFMLGYVFYVLFLIHSGKEEKAYHFRDFMRYVFDFEYITPIKSRVFRRAKKKDPTDRTLQENLLVKLFKRELLKDIGITIVSCVAVVLGAKYLISESIWMARLLNVPESVIGLSMVAVGTSLPELTVSVSAARQGRGEMVVGNVVGSNIANILFILGVSGSIFPMDVGEISVIYTIPILLFFSLGFLYFIKSDWEIKRHQGWIAIASYFLFMMLAFIMGWS